LQVYRAFADLQEPGWQGCDLIGFTMSWELGYLNVLKLLQKLGTHVLSKDRGKGEPLVFGGGPVLTANPEPFADIFDIVLIGDAEELVPRFIAAWKSVRTLNDRQDQLKVLARVEGVYVPGLYRYRMDISDEYVASVEPIDESVPQHVNRQAFTIPPAYVAHTLILSPGATWGEMFLIEVARGCPQHCHFCLAAHLNRPFRPAWADAITRAIDLGLKYTRRIGLLGASVTEHPQFAEIAGFLLERQAAVSVSSLRADSIDPLVLRMLVQLGQKTVTMAIESGSERLRTLIGKDLSQDQINESMDLIGASGLEGVKLYALVGLPEETWEDLDESVRLLQQLKKRYRRLRINLALNSFVPKAQTPFERVSRDRDCSRKLEYMRKHIAGTGVTIRSESSNWSDIQALLSRADRRLTPVLLAAAESGGNLGSWRKALRDRSPGCPGMDHYVFRNVPDSEIQPWEHVAHRGRQTRPAGD
jgi:radical SAM superfamily enzyme YgiQ (UPF0313 family)